MRSSKNRSRSKGNRNRSVGNIVNRVFDSSGPEGKVRGTPQQIIDKYNQLARDAQLGNDRVAAENFQQHAEHYLRMLAEAQREQDARREQQQNNQQNNNQQQNHQSGGGQQGDGRGTQGDGTPGEQAARKADAPDGRGLDQVMDPGAPGDGDSTLVATPESSPKPKRSRTRRPRKPEAGDDGQAPQSASAEGAAPRDDSDGGGPKEAAE